MTTSIEKKVDKFLDDWGNFVESPYYELFEKDLKKLFLEHERDTRYTAIDIIQAQKQYPLQVVGSYWTDSVNTEETINNIHNMKVGLESNERRYEYANR